MNRCKALASQGGTRLGAAGRWLRQDVQLIDVIELLALPLAISLVRGLVRVVNNVVEPEDFLLWPRATHR